MRIFLTKEIFHQGSRGGPNQGSKGGSDERLCWGPRQGLWGLDEDSDKEPKDDQSDDHEYYSRDPSWWW